MAETVHLLLVDDDKDEYILTRKKLAEMSTSYRLRWVDTFESAVAELEQHTPDVCLVDYQLGGHTGLELIDHVKSKGALIPFILLTGHASVELNRAAIQAGADDYLPKRELTASTLERAIYHSLERKKTTLALLDSEEQLRALAEFSSGTLHNIGNILTSLLVTTNRTKELLQASKIGSLTLVADLIEKNRDHFADFIRDHPKGKVLPDYIVNLAEVIESERKALSHDVNRNLKHMKLIESVIKSQQSSARERFSEEHLSLVQIVEDALLVKHDSLTQQGVSVVRQIRSRPVVTGSRSKLTHVLINLIKNAIEAMETSDRKEIIISLDSVDAVASLRLTDTGNGIPASMVHRLFEHGFTTKVTGHGFGLHYCIKTMAEMGGRIELEHTEEGKGTTFLLTLPDVARTSG